MDILGNSDEKYSKNRKYSATIVLRDLSKFFRSFY
jgi:hypothetical protein